MVGGFGARYKQTKNELQETWLKKVEKKSTLVSESDRSKS